MSKYMQDMLDKQAFIDQNMQKKSPFDEGVMRAIKSAKQSIGMDKEQSDKAFRTGLMGFSEALNQDQTPVGRGFMGKFAAAARGMPAGMRAYDQSEATSRNENSLHADMAHRFRAAEEAKIAKMEQDAYMREMNDRKMALEQERLGEMRDYHKGMLAKSNPLTNLSTPFVQSGKFTTHNSKLRENKLSSDFEKASNLNHKINNIKNEYLELKKMIEDTGLPFNDATLQSLNQIPIVSSLMGSFRDEDDPYRKIVEKAGLIRSETDLLATEFEQMAKGRGVTDYFVQYANKRSLFPKLGETSDFMVKLDNLGNETELAANAADASLRYGINVNKNNYKDFLTLKNKLEQQGVLPTYGNTYSNEQLMQAPEQLMQTPEQVNQNVQSNKILMIDPETGEQDYVDVNRVEEAQRVDGLQVVNE